MIVAWLGASGNSAYAIFTTGLACRKTELTSITMLVWHSALNMAWLKAAMGSPLATAKVSQPVFFIIISDCLQRGSEVEGWWSPWPKATIQEPLLQGVGPVDCRDCMHRPCRIWGTRTRGWKQHAGVQCLLLRCLCSQSNISHL